MPGKLTFFFLVITLAAILPFHANAMKQADFDQLKTWPDSEAKVDSLLKLAKAFWYKDPGYSISIAKYGHQISIHGNYREKQADALNIIGAAFYFREELDSAVYYFNNSLELCRSLEYLEGIARVTNNLGLIHDFLGNYDRAIAFYYQSLEIEKESNNNEGIASTYLNIGTIYYYLKEFDKALDYMTNSLRLYQLEKYEDGILRCFTNIGTIYSEIGIPENALTYAMKALDLSRRMNNPDVEAANLNNIGEIYFSMKDYEKSIDYYNQALFIEKQFNDQWSQANTIRNIGNVYLSRGMYQKAEVQFKESLAIARRIEAMALLRDLYYDLYLLYEAQENFQTALGFHIKHTRLKDSIFGEERRSDIARLESANKLKNKDQLLDAARSENNVKSLTIKSQRYALIITAVFIMLVFSFVILFYNRSRANKKERLLLERTNSMISDQKILLEQTVSQLKESEEKYKALTYSIQDGLIIIQDKRLIFLNDAFCQILGYETHQEVMALKTSDIISEDDLQTVIKNYNDRVAGKKVPKSYSIKVKNKAGNIVEVSVRVKLIMLNKKPAIIGTIKDISKAAGYEKELITAKEKAEKATRSKSVFLAGMSHEIRNHLNSILGFTEVLDNTKLTREQKEYLEIIRTSGDTLIKISNDILDLSKIEAGQLMLNIHDFGLRKIIREAISNYELEASKKGLSITTEISDKIPDLQRGDPTRLFQVLINLLGNALKFTDQGGITIGAEPIRIGTDENWIKINIRDTGIGISKTSQEEIFKPFSQAHAALSRKIDGSGLGLTISKQIIQLAGGEIGVESQEGKGSNFWFTMRSVEASPGSRATARKTNNNHSGNRILLVEDNLVNQHLTTSILNKEGYIPDIAANGKEGVDLFMKNFYDVILMDIQMPVMDGLEATSRIRDYEMKNYSIKSTIIAITAHAKESDQQKLLDAGLDYYLQKPFKPEELLSIIRKPGN